MSKCHKIAIDYETNLSRTCGNVWEMSSDAAKKKTKQNKNKKTTTTKKQWSLTVYASSKPLNVCSILPGKDRLCRVKRMMNQTLFNYLN